MGYQSPLDRHTLETAPSMREYRASAPAGVEVSRSLKLTITDGRGAGGLPALMSAAIAWALRIDRATVNRPARCFVFMTSYSR